MRNINIKKATLIIFSNTRLTGGSRSKSTFVSLALATKLTKPQALYTPPTLFSFLITQKKVLG